MHVLTDDCHNIAVVLRALADRQYVFKITKELQHWLMHCSQFQDNITHCWCGSVMVTAACLLCWLPMYCHPTVYTVLITMPFDACTCYLNTSWQLASSVSSSLEHCSTLLCSTQTHHHKRYVIIWLLYMMWLMTVWWPRTLVQVSYLQCNYAVSVQFMRLNYHNDNH